MQRRQVAPAREESLQPPAQARSEDRNDVVSTVSEPFEVSLLFEAVVPEFFGLVVWRFVRHGGGRGARCMERSVTLGRSRHRCTAESLDFIAKLTSTIPVLQQ